MLPKEISDNLSKIKRISKRLRKERELSFYGADDFIPLEEYDREEALKAVKDAEFVVNTILRAYEK